MTTNRTIDGVPREDLELVLTHGCSNQKADDAWNRLRALLDAPAVQALEKCGVQMVDCPECSHQWDHFFNCGNKPAAQPQGEPEACQHEWTDDGEFTLVCTACGAKEDYTQALQHAFELGGTDDGSYHLEADELCEILRLYAEQPAPVAVVLPEQLNPAELDELEVIEALLSGQGLSNLAGTMAAARQFIEEVTRLNPSL